MTSPDPTSPASDAPAPRPRAASPRPSVKGAETTSGTLPRWKGRPQSAPTAKIGMALFGVGVVAVAVAMVLFATGSSDLPLWLNLLAMLAPIGLGVGLVGVFRESRSQSRELAQRKLDKEAAEAAAKGESTEEWNLPDLADKGGSQS